MENKKKDEGPNLMYNQLRKFISVVVSAYLQAAAFAVIFLSLTLTSFILG
jgi:hypothetical protein